MASRVNVKFVVLLSASLTAVFVLVAGVAIWVLSHTGPELEREGDQLMAAGRYEDAMKVYGKAYNHDRSDIGRLDKYTNAIRAWTPDKPAAYSSAYWEKLLPAIYTRATILRTDVDSHDRYLQARYTLARWFAGRESWDALASATDVALGYFGQDGSEDAQWQKLRRYRGFALVALMNLSGDRSDAERDHDVDQAEQDFQAALRINPGDTRAAVDLSRFYYLKSVQLMESRRTRDEAAELLQHAADTIDSFIASHPDDAAARAHSVLLTYVTAQIELDTDLRGIDLIDARRAIAQGLSGHLDQLFDVLDRAPPEAIDAFLVDGVASLERLITEQTARSAQLVDRLLADRPDEPALLSSRAMFSREAGDFERALTLYDRVADQEWISVSMDGVILMLMQDNAQIARTDTALMIWDSADEADKPAALQRVRQFREEVAAKVRQNDPRLTLIDGKIAYADGDFTTAQQKLTQYNEIAGGHDATALHLLANIYLRNNEFGSARDAFRELIDLQPQVLTHYLSLARVEAALNDRESARMFVEAALRIDPDSEVARDLLAELRALEDPAALQATDPVRAALIRSEKLTTGEGGVAPDVDGAIAVVDAAISALDPSSPEYASGHESLVVRRVNLVAISGDRATALENARHWSATYPDSEPLSAMIARLSAPDTLEGDYLIIDAGTEAEHIKLVFKYYAALRRDDMDRATEMLSSAIKLAPDDAVVLEVAFGDALFRTDFTTAQQLADKAASQNADRMNGASFTARLQAAQGDIAEAVTTLRQATKSATTPAAAWRMMGVFQSQLGRQSEAINSFQDALRRSPSDVATILGYLDALLRAGQASEALRVAREYEPVARHDGRFLSAWLALEAVEGDMQFALARREEIRSRLPDNRPNNSALVSLYIESDRFDDARTLLDEMRTGGLDLLTVNLDAALHRKRSDIDGGRAVYEAYLDSLSQSDAGPTFEDFAAYASYLFDAELVEDSLAVLDRALAVQSPDTHDADVAMGRLLYELGRYEEAIDPLTRALPAGAPMVQAQLASCYARLGRYEQAETTITQADGDWTEDLQLMLAMIECADRQGDAERTRRLADDAVRRFSESPAPFIQRARLLARDNDLLRDALQDLNTAVRRDPTNWIALSLRADVNRRLGREEDTLADLRSAVRSNPGLDLQRRILILNLIRTGRERDAAAVADEAIATRQDDLPLVLEMGNLFAQTGLWDLAARYFIQAWDRSPSEATAIPYVKSIIDSSRPVFSDAERVLADPVSNTANSAQLLMLRAALRMKQKLPNESRSDAREAIRLASPDLNKTARLLEDLNPIFSSEEEAARFILQLDLSAVPGRGADYFRAIAQLHLADQMDEGMQMLRDLSEDQSEVVIRRNARRLLVEKLLHPSRREFAEALKLMQAGLEEQPDDWTYANNIAFVLSMEMDQPAEALRFAEQALEIAPNVPSVLDTLGYVYRRLQRYDESERYLRRAVEQTPDPVKRLDLLVHLGQMFADKGDKAAALRVIDGIDAILKALNISGTNNQDLQELRQRVEGLQ